MELLGAPLVKLALVLVLGALAPFLDTTIVNVALHTLAGQFHVGVPAVQWVSTAYLLALAITVPITGWASDRFGARNVWLLALVVFTVGSVLAAVSWSLGSLIVFRVVQGVGAGLIQPVIQTMLVRAAGPDRLGRLLTIVTLVAVVAPIGGPLVGGVITAHASWRWIFLVNVPLCGAALIGAWRVVPRTEPTRTKRLDVVGLALISPGLVAVLYGLTRAAAAGFGRADVLGPIVGGLVLLGAYVVRRTPGLVDLSLFRIRSFAAACAVLFVAGLSPYGAMLLLPLYYQQVRGQDALVAGLMPAPQGIGSLLSRPVGTVVDRIGARWIVLGGIVLCAVGTVPYAMADARTSQWLLGCALVVRGAGLSAATLAVMTGAFVDVPRAGVADASTITRVLQQVGGSFGTSVLAVVLAGGGAGVGAGTTATAYDTAFRWSIGFTVLALVPAFLLRSSRTARAASPMATTTAE